MLGSNPSPFGAGFPDLSTLGMAGGMGGGMPNLADMQRQVFVVVVFLI